MSKVLVLKSSILAGYSQSVSCLITSLNSGVNTIPQTKSPCVT